MSDQGYPLSFCPIHLREAQAIAFEKMKICSGGKNGSLMGEKQCQSAGQ